MGQLLQLLAALIVWIVSIIIAHMLGYEAGKSQAKPATPTPAPVIHQKLTAAELDNHCVAWFFDSNFKEAKKRICKGTKS